MARVLTVDPVDPDLQVLADAAAVLTSGGLVAFPTETVYGLGADALSDAAVAAIFVAKRRPPTDPLIVHLAGADQLHTVARDVPSVVAALADVFWPGPLTLILHKQPAVPAAVTAGLSTVGVRVPSHPVAQRLLRLAAIPVAAPSANRFSRPSPTTAAHVLDDLGDAIDMVVDAGHTPIGVESTILDLTVSPPLVRRPGGVPLDEIRRLLPDAIAVASTLTAVEAQPAPGQLTRHYAPRARLTLYLGAPSVVCDRMAADARTAAAAGNRVGILAPEEDLRVLAPRLAAVAATGRILTARCGSRRDPDAAAHELFRAIRDLDAERVDVMLASAPEAGRLSDAVVDRLTRAAEGRVIVVRD